MRNKDIPGDIGPLIPMPEMGRIEGPLSGTGQTSVSLVTVGHDTTGDLSTAPQLPRSAKFTRHIIHR